MIIIRASLEYKNFVERKKIATFCVSNARYLMVLNHITRVLFLPLPALSPAGSGSFLFYLFRLSTAVLEARRDFAAIYFMRVTSFSALSLRRGVPILAVSSQRLTLAMFLWSSTASDTHKHAYTQTHIRAHCTCRLYNDVFVSIVKAAPSVLFYTYFALIHPSRPLTPPTTT